MRITLIKPHTRAGHEYPPGAVLDVPHSVAVWLQEQGVASSSPALPMNGEGALSPLPARGAAGRGRKPRLTRSTPVQTTTKEG